MPEYIDCDLCASKESKKYYEIDSSGKIWNLVQCKKCGLVYLNPQPTREEIKALYLKDYFDCAYLRQEAQGSLMRAGIELTKDIEKYRRPGKILDIGTAGGHYLKAARDRGWEAFGVELSAYAVSWAKEKFGLAIFNGTLEEAVFAENFFDVITINQALEHFPDPLAVLRKARQVLKDNGLLYVSVPNISVLENQIKRGGKLGAVREEEHLFWFSFKTLKMMLEKAGFKIFKVKRGPSLSAVASANIGIPPAAVSQVSSLMNKYFVYPKEVLRELVARIIPGGAIIIYAQKNEKRI